MKKALAVLLCLLPTSLFADPWATAKSRNAGNSIRTASVTVTTHTATQIVDPTYAIQSAAVDIFCNNAYTLWIGSNTTSLTTMGLPILSSKTFTTDGVYTGSLYGMADAAAGGDTNVRVIYWIKSDALR
jgi:hypothetical protein